MPEAYIPTQPAQAIKEARISLAHEDPRRPKGTFSPPRQGAQAGLSKTRFPRIVQCGADSLVRLPLSPAAKFGVTVTASVPGKANQDAKPKMAKAGFPRSARLLRHSDFERVYKQGKRHFSASITVFYLHRQESPDKPSATHDGLRVGSPLAARWEARCTAIESSAACEKPYG
jgi:Ribonuclease P.